MSHCADSRWLFIAMEYMEWFKFYGGDYLSDPKMLSLTSDERSCWLTLLSYASMAEGGIIKHLDENRLMMQAGLDPQYEDWVMTQGVLKKFEKLGMIQISNEEITIKNWRKRQQSYLTNAQRQARFREKHKSNADVTPMSDESNARIEENRIEETSDSSEESPALQEPTHEDLEIEGVDDNGDPYEKKGSRAKYPNSKEVFALFPHPQKNWEMNTTELKHSKLLYERGLPKVRNILQFIKENEDNPKFFYNINKPSDLERSWLGIVKFKQKNGL